MAYPRTDKELWELMEQDVTRSPRHRPNSREMDSKMPASSPNNDASDNDNFQMLQDDDNSGSNENDADEAAQEGYPLNKDVLPGEEDFNNDGYLNVGVNTELRQAFREYCGMGANNLFPHLTEHEARGI